MVCWRPRTEQPPRSPLAGHLGSPRPQGSTGSRARVAEMARTSRDPRHGTWGPPSHRGVCPFQLAQRPALALGLRGSCTQQWRVLSPCLAVRGAGEGAGSRHGASEDFGGPQGPCSGWESHPLSTLR